MSVSTRRHIATFSMPNASVVAPRSGCQNRDLGAHWHEPHHCQQKCCDASVIRLPYFNFLIINEKTKRSNRDLNSTTAEASLLLDRTQSHGTNLVCLNFKVPLHIRQEFKACAARRNMTMTDLLLQLLDGCLKSDDSNTGPRLLVVKK